MTRVFDAYEWKDPTERDRRPVMDPLANRQNDLEDAVAAGSFKSFSFQYGDDLFRCYRPGDFPKEADEEEEY